MNDNNFINSIGNIKNANGETIIFFTENNLKDNSSIIYAQNTNSSTPVAIYASGDNIIIDASIVSQTNITGNVLTAILWCEKKGISSETELHYGKLDNSLNLIRQFPLDISATTKEHAIAKGCQFNEQVVICWIDSIEQRVKLRLYSSNDLSPASDEYKISELPSRNYFNSSCTRSANMTLTKRTESEYILQFLLSAGNLCSYQINIGAETISAIRLFESGSENTGFHNSIYDSEQNAFITVFSENKLTLTNNTNNIYIIKQQLFTSQGDYVNREEPKRINQSLGFYLRPLITKINGQFVVLWEGSQLHFIGLNADLDIQQPESILSVDRPARISLSEGDSSYISAQKNNWSSNDYGESMYFEIFNI